MVINVIMSCSSSSKLLEYWPIVSKMWGKIGFNPILGILGDLTKSQLSYLNNYGTVYNFFKIKNIPEETQSKLIKYYICKLVNSEDIVIFSELNLLLLNRDWISSLVYKLKDNVIIPWPELKSEYLMGKARLFVEIFNNKLLDYNSWIESLVIEGFNDSDKEGIITNIDFSEKGFLYNIVNRLDGAVNILLVGREDIFFTNENSYGMTKRTDWENWENLSLDSDIDIVGPVDLKANYDKMKTVFQVMGLSESSNITI